MVTQEFYIRNAPETEARGPFNHEHMVSLAENGQITKETLYYDAGAEQWMALETNAAVCAIVFPQKVALKLKSKTKFKTLNVADDNAAPVSVVQLLAAADGRTAETADKLDPAIARERAAGIGRWSATVILCISAAALCLPSIDLLTQLNLEGLLLQPLALLGVGQALLALLLILQVTQAYPFVRFSATLGIGMVGFILWTRGQTTPMASFALGSLGLYFCTVFINFIGVGLAAGLGLAGMAGYALFALTT
jgi:hypothetical protein